jgi:Mrp family chromosome partitioning ATPase
MSALEKLVWGVGWGKLDVMVVDMPPGTGDMLKSLFLNASLWLVQPTQQYLLESFPLKCNFHL